MCVVNATLLTGEGFGVSLLLRCELTFVSEVNVGRERG